MGSAEDHLKTAKTYEDGAKKLEAHRGQYWPCVVTLTFQAAHNYLCVFFHRRGENLHDHIQILSQLYKMHEFDLADAFQSLDGLRAGRGYRGEQKNGETAEKALALLAKIRDASLREV